MAIVKKDLMVIFEQFTQIRADLRELLGVAGEIAEGPWKERALSLLEKMLEDSFSFQLKLGNVVVALPTELGKATGESSASNNQS